MRRRAFFKSLAAFTGLTCLQRLIPKEEPFACVIESPTPEHTLYSEHWFTEPVDMSKCGVYQLLRDCPPVVDDAKDLDIKDFMQRCYEIKRKRMEVGS